MKNLPVDIGKDFFYDEIKSQYILVVLQKGLAEVRLAPHKLVGCHCKIKSLLLIIKKTPLGVFLRLEPS
ncbi:hypothetical protein COK18_07920 [Bacillus cereus]|nr:hypothetical protein COK18_07920 [Bacillus cereus]